MMYRILIKYQKSISSFYFYHYYYYYFLPAMDFSRNISHEEDLDETLEIEELRCAICYGFSSRSLHSFMYCCYSNICSTPCLVIWRRSNTFQCPKCTTYLGNSFISQPKPNDYATKLVGKIKQKCSRDSCTQRIQRESLDHHHTICLRERPLSIEELNVIIQSCRRDMNGWLSAERKNEAWLIMKKFYFNKEYIQQILTYLTINTFNDIPPYIVADFRNELDSDHSPGLAPVFFKDMV